MVDHKLTLILGRFGRLTSNEECDDRPREAIV